VHVKEIEDASLTEAIHGRGRAKNRNIGNSVFIELKNVGVYLGIIIAPTTSSVESRSSE
jgi:hypothetical protein